MLIMHDIVMTVYVKIVCILWLLKDDQGRENLTLIIRQLFVFLVKPIDGIN